jgi:hypothetical protein
MTTEINRPRYRKTHLFYFIYFTVLRHNVEALIFKNCHNMILIDT